MNVNFQLLNDMDLIFSYSEIIKLMKQRNIIRSKNVVGDLGEYMAIKHFNNTPGLPTLLPAQTGTKNIDAISNNGDRYSIKTTSGKVTGVFYGLNPIEETGQSEKQHFEYVLVVILGDNMELRRINELTWEQFIQYKRWHSRMKAWNLPINSKLLNDTRTIYIGYAQIY